MPLSHGPHLPNVRFPHRRQRACLCDHFLKAAGRQLPTLASDAYATGQALVALSQCGAGGKAIKTTANCVVAVRFFADDKHLLFILCKQWNACGSN
jgi:hypothetical protein